MAGLLDGGRASVVDRTLQGGNLSGFASQHKDQSQRAAFTASGAADPGQSAPENASSPSGNEPSSPAANGCCTCQSYTVQIPAEDTDPRTGEVTEPSFERRSTAVFCPVHGVNDDYRRSLTAHAAWIAERGKYRRCDAYHVTIRLHRADVERLGVSADDTRPVLSQLLPRLRKRLKRRDDGAEVLLSLSPRPSDGQWHLHALVLSKGCRGVDVIDAFDLAGTDVEVTTPRSREEGHDGPPMSAETFAACIGAYLFDNRVQGAVQGAETKFSSWGKGVGYFSEEARSRRREYAEKMAETEGESAPTRCTSTQFRTHGQSDNDDDRGSGADNTGTGEAISGTNNTETEETGDVPPVTVGVNVVQSEAEYRRVVIKALLERQYTTVRVMGMGRCKLTWVEVGDEGTIICSVRPLERRDDDGRYEVPWRIVEAAETPVIRRSTASKTDTDDMDAPDDEADTTAPAEPDAAPDDGADDSADVVDRYLSEARYSRVSFVLPDGRRRVRETDHKTGETTTTTKPPRT